MTVILKGASASQDATIDSRGMKLLFLRSRRGDTCYCYVYLGWHSSNAYFHYVRFKCVGRTPVRSSLMIVWGCSNLLVVFVTRSKEKANCEIVVLLAWCNPFKNFCWSAERLINLRNLKNGRRTKLRKFQF
jgi:hypothetical protein